MARRYLVDMRRTAYHRFVVEADTQDEARAKAEQMAYDTNWSGFPADYGVDDVTEAKKEEVTP